MQNRYVGDVADFGKHGLLRFLSGMTDPTVPKLPLRLGLVWYMFPDERHGADRKKINGDGGHIGYLEQTEGNSGRFGLCDPPLWEKLRNLVCEGRRCVHCAQGAGILPNDTLFYDAMLHYVPGLSGDTKGVIRDRWLKGALTATRDAKVVMVDPDNGITTNNDKMYLKNGPKHVYMDDLRAIWDRKQSLVVYHHLPMDKLANDAIREKADLLRSELGQEPIALRYHRGSARVFYVIPQPDDNGDLIRARVGRFLDTCWKAHFTQIEWQSTEIGDRGD